MSITTMVQVGSSVGDKLNLPRRVGQYLLARRTAIPTSRNRRRSEPELLVKPASQTAQVPTSVGRGSRTTTVSICGDSRELGGSLPSEGLPIDAFPFVVGRLPERWESAPEIDVNVTLEDSRPYRMSRAHFAILRTEDGFQVHDLESTLGTSVNGMLLGRHFGRDRISLKRGDNFITAGGVGSQFRFKLAW